MDLEDRINLIKKYFKDGLTYKEIAITLKDNDGIIISVRQLKRLLKDSNLRRREYDNLNIVIESIKKELTGSGQLHGYRIMHQKLKQMGIQVRKEDVRLILSVLDPVNVELRASRRLKRRAYFAKGPNYIWHIDGYDKLKPFGLCISGAIDGYSRKLIWLKVYHTNNDPKVVGGYYLEAVSEYGGCPRIVRGDRGTENGHVRNFQIFFRENNDGHSPENAFLYGSSTSNQRIESWWGFLRKECVQFWMELFKTLQEDGYYVGDFLDKELIRFCFTSVLQVELDSISKLWDMHIIRPSKNEEVPSGRPKLMFNTPSLWGDVDHLCGVSDIKFDACSNEVTLRSLVVCDADVYALCIYVMK